MPSKILVLNSGSSSVKYRLFSLNEAQECRSLIAGLIERIGEADSGVPDHRHAIVEMVRSLESQGHLGSGELLAVGHRVVHGGESFNRAVLANAAVMDAIRAAIPLAPLHNSANLLGIEACRERWPELPQVAVFDTAFHYSLPPAAYRYAIPDEAYREHAIRRYGFHGTSFESIKRQVAQYLGQAGSDIHLIVLHLGNGASACAIRGGKSIDTSMGMTPLAGLMMGTRCGDLDPGVILYWLEQAGQLPTQISNCLNRDSGLKGIAGTNDMRDVLARAGRDDAEARLAVDMYVHRLRHYIGAYRAFLPELHALVFTGGVGEHAPAIRSAACRDLLHLGLHLDEDKNQATLPGLAEIQSSHSAVKIMVIPTDEEGEIARQALELLSR
jgi:acetate kinase